MNQNTEIKYLYTVLFWACPKSGFDLIKKNAVMKILKEALLEFAEKDIDSKIEGFESKNEGLVTYEEVIESDTLILNPELEVMPIIRKKYPEAQFINIYPLTHKI